MNRHVLSMHDLTADDVTRVLDTAESFREVGSRVIKKVPALRGRTVVNFFPENSTRTRISFELAGARLSAGSAAAIATRPTSPTYSARLPPASIVQSSSPRSATSAVPR